MHLALTATLFAFAGANLVLAWETLWHAYQERRTRRRRHAPARMLRPPRTLVVTALLVAAGAHVMFGVFNVATAVHSAEPDKAYLDLKTENESLHRKIHDLEVQNEALRLQQGHSPKIKKHTRKS